MMFNKDENTSFFKFFLMTLNILIATNYVLAQVEDKPLEDFTISYTLQNKNARLILKNRSKDTILLDTSSIVRFESGMSVVYKIGLNNCGGLLESYFKPTIIQPHDSIEINIYSYSNSFTAEFLYMDNNMFNYLINNNKEVKYYYKKSNVILCTPFFLLARKKGIIIN